MSEFILGLIGGMLIVTLLILVVDPTIRDIKEGIEISELCHSKGMIGTMIDKETYCQSGSDLYEVKEIDKEYFVRINGGFYK